MPSLVVLQGGLLTLRWTSGGVVSWLNVLGILNAGAVSFTQTLANTIDTGIKAQLVSSGLAALLSPNCALASCGIRDIRNPNLAEWVGAGASQAGTAATETAMLPLQTSLVITLRTALAGKHYRGRVYLSGFAELHNNATGAAASTTAPVAFVTGIKTVLTSNGLDLAVISRPNLTITPVWGGQANVVSAIVARDSAWDTQRRRAYPGV